MLAWPHAQTDWAPRLAAIQTAFSQMIRTLAQEIPVVLLVPDHSMVKTLKKRFTAAPCPVYCQVAPYNDTWLRDSIFLSAVSDPRKETNTQQPSWLALDFPFSGWGGKYNAHLDNQLNRYLLEKWRKLDHWQPRDFELEGGSVDFDGQGTVLTTSQCLQSRHPVPTPVLEEKLKQALNVHRVLWLTHGAIEGDDTDSHVDMLARFAGADRIVYQSCGERADKHYEELQAMTDELHTFRQANGQPYKLYPLPWPDAIYDSQSGRRLPASYANFLISNKRVFVPVYDCPQDQQALAVMQDAFPTHRIEAVPCRDLIWQNGSLHCSTMQLPLQAFTSIQPQLSDENQIR